MATPMESHSISFGTIPGTSALFRDYLYNFEKLASFYKYAPFAENGFAAAAADVRLGADHRRALCQALSNQGERYAADEMVSESLRRLSVEGCVSVVTGQQVGLFGGPAYTVYKAVTAIRLARDLTAQGVEAVPVFWLASYDHDFDEVRRTTVLNGQAELVELEDSSRPPRNAPVGDVRFGPQIDRLRNRIARLWPKESAHRADEAEELLRGYAAGRSYSDGIGTLLQGLFRGQGLIVMDPRAGEIQRLAQPIYRRVLGEGPDLVPALLSQNDKLRAAGYHAQVDVRDDTTLLFAEFDGQRRLLRRAGAGFATAGQNDYSEEEVFGKLDDSPQLFSPSALLRPVVQDFLLPTVAYVGGPAEVAYMAQARPLFDRLLGRMPVVIPRASVTLVEPKVQRTLRKYALDIEKVFVPRVRLRGKVALSRVPRRLAGKMERTAQRLDDMLASTQAAVGQLDSTLAGAAATSRNKMFYQFEKLRGKVASVQAERNGIVDRHTALLHNSLYPGKALQERRINFLSFVSRYGRSLVQYLLDDDALRGPDHRVIPL